MSTLPERPSRMASSSRLCSPSFFCSEPLDKMSHELQTLEADGKVLLDAGRAGEGPVCAAGAELYRRVAEPESYFGMGCVVRHFEGHRDVDPVDVARLVRNKSLDLAAAAWTRLELPLSVFPLRLFAFDRRAHFGDGTGGHHP